MAAAGGSRVPCSAARNNEVVAAGLRAALEDLLLRSAAGAPALPAEVVMEGSGEYDLAGGGRRRGVSQPCRSDPLTSRPNPSPTEADPAVPASDPQRHGVVFAGAGAAGEPKAILKALGSGKLLIEGSLSFKRAQAALQVETEISIRGAAAALATEPAGAPLPREVARARFADLPDSPATQSPKHEAAALMLQKVYKSFRTCRQLADCAVLVDQSWWKLLDFALLKRSSVSLDIEKQETAVSKWSRARTRAAKVGKGLLKDDKAQKLALQHWLEAIDP